MKRFSIIHIPLLSFFSKELYRDVGLNWKGIGFAYLLLLLAVCSVPRMFKIQAELSQFIDEEVLPIIEQVPKITITDGQVYVDVPQPYYIRDPDSNDVLAIIDTTGETESLVDTDAFALLTKTKLIHRQSDVEYRIHDLSDVRQFVLDKGPIMNWLNIVNKVKVLVPVLYPFVVLLTFLFRIFQALVYGVIGLLFASWCRVKLSYSSLLRIAVVAVTPCIIVKTIFKVASVHIFMAGLWFFLMAMVYLLFGVKACSQTGGQSTLRGGILPEDEQRL